MINKMRVIIVEDQNHQREALNHLLSLHPDVEVVGAFEDTASAWPLIEAGDVDGAFLDIEILSEGKEAGLNLARKIDNLRLHKPWVVFTTDFEKYARPAIDVRPFGYYDKPVSNLKVTDALNKIRNAIPSTESKQKIEVRHRTVDRGEMSLCTKYLAQKDIIYVQSNNEGNTTKKEMLNKTKAQLINNDSVDGIINKTLEQWLSETSKSWVDEKGEPIIMRIYTSYLVNLNYVNGYKPDLDREGCYLVTFQVCKDELPIGRKYFNDLRDALNKRGLKVNDDDSTNA
ncbi:MAG: LytTR family DNA-binding domain-containing protein [Methyloglobulus sp.]|nr:response regulator transcription factor [Methyloglobulus sp.]